MSRGAKKGFLGEIWEVIKILLMAMVLAMVIVQFIRPTRVDGLSMYPTLDNNDYLIINRVSRYTGVDRGDVVVFDSDMPINAGEDQKSTAKKVLDVVLQDDSSTKDLVKRVIAVGGDHITVKDGVVKVNDQKISEPYVSEGNITEGNIDTVVPEGMLFCMGDNRMRSLDSRYPEVGFVPEKKLVGSVLVRLLPLENIGRVN
ncbi:MAG: signal peptidase I [Peptostreptococcus sp.]|uniref:signal peptidase I n=1 Tax=Peptostreptococcus sp. TaxID=1262 RepID=UPI002FCC8BBF